MRLFLVPPWQGGIDIRVLWYFGCQSDFDEIVSLASRPADRGFDRMAEIKVPFHPVKCGFGRMGTQLEVFARSKHTINH